MALKQTLEASEFETLADPLKEHYTKDGDGYKLETDFVPEDTSALKSALQKEREARKDLVKEIAKYKDIDPDKARAAQVKLDEIEQKQLEDAKEYEQLKGKLAGEKQAAVDAVKSEFEPKLQKTQSKLREVMIRKALQDEALKHDPISAESIEAFVELAEKQVSMDDELNLVIEGSTSNDISEFVKNLSETPKFGVFFKPDVAAGSGASTQKKAGAGTKTTEKKFSDSSNLEKSRYITQHGLEKFKEWRAKG